MLLLDDPLTDNLLKRWAVVVAQLAERSLLTPEIRISNPINGKILSTICTIKNKKVENEEKEEKKSVMAHL